MLSYQFFIFLFIHINTFDITSFKINFFKEDQKLYYVIPMNDDNGDLYFEFSGENNAIRYFIGINYLTEERIKFNGNEVYSIETNSISTFHESIIVNINNEINILSVNSNYFNFINIKESSHTFKETKDFIFESNGIPAKRNCIIKLKDNTYLLSMLLHKLSAHYRNYRIFKFTKSNIDGYKKIKGNLDDIVDYVSTVSCIQTENTYIQCSFSNLLKKEEKYFTVGIYNLNLFQRKDLNLAKIEAESFTKIIHIKGEIAAYIFFDIEKNNAPTLLIKKLDINNNKLDDIITNKNNIIENIGYDIDIGTFSSDAIKIDDTRFAIFFTIKSTYNLLLCLFDFNKDYTAIKVRYYVLDFNTINIQISVNMRAFIFKDYFGLLFYDSASTFPGYIFFNYVKLTSNNKIGPRTIMINDLGDFSSVTFSIFDYLEFINNIYDGPIKIRIESLSTKEESGISTKSSNLNSEISIGDILDINDIIIFEKKSAQSHDYFLEFLPIVEEIDVRTEIFGTYEENDFEQIGYFTKHIFNIIIPNGKNCSDEDYIYLRNEQEKFCLVSCDSYKEKQLYQDENEKICYNFCSEAKNGNIFTYLFTCVSNCPSDLVPNENNFCVSNVTLFPVEEYEEELEEESDESYEDNLSLEDELKNNGCNYINISFVSCTYPSDADVSYFEEKYPFLTLVNIDDCKNKLINEHIIDNNTIIYIKENHDIYDIENYEFELFLQNGTKLNKSLCDDTKLDISKPLDPKTKDMDEKLSSQGYDMFDLSSNLYTDNCISVELNESDVTLGTRQKDIKSAANSVCPQGCSLKEKKPNSNRVSCSCDNNYIEKNKESNIEKQEVKENFFSYIFNMINYKVLSCFEIMNNFQNYISNYGFLIGASIYLMILILFIIYLCRGNTAIKIKYLHHEPKIDENKKSYIIDLSDISKKFKLSSSRNNIIEKDNSLFNNQNAKMENKNNSNPPKRKSSRSFSVQNETININKSNKKKKNKNKKTKKIKTKIKDNDIQSKIIISMNEEPKKDEKNSIEYNELTYGQALLKDERNILQIFISYFNSKLDLIQIFFYPKEFDHFSLSLTLFLYELLIDFTLNALLFSDDVISQKYYNNGSLLFVTSNILSIASNIFSSFFGYLIEFLVNYNEVLDSAKQETNSEKLFYKIFLKIYKLIICKIRIFYFFVFISGFCCVYYLLLFCSIYKRIQKNLFINYIIGTLWSFGYKIFFSILTTIMRKIALIKRFKRLYLIAKFIDEKL